MVEELLPPVPLDKVYEVFDNVVSKARMKIEPKAMGYNRHRLTIDKDALANFKLCKYNGSADTVCQGILIRMSDKMSRFISYGRNPALGMSIDSAKIDSDIEEMVVYCAIFKIFYDIENEVIHKRQDISNISDQ